MTAKSPRPPDGEAWIWLTRELLASDAWRSAGINARRLIDFLMREHLRHGGKENGKLKAPYEQLQGVGIGARHVTAAIAEAEEMGLVECRRGGLRVATTYALTWMQTDNGAPATNRWRDYRKPRIAATSTEKIQKSTFRREVSTTFRREGR